MLSKEDLGRLLEYTVWANRRVVRAAATLSVNDFKRDMGGSHGGVRGTLTHILGAEWIWLERWKGVSPSRGLDEGEFKDVLALRARFKLIEAHRDAWFESLKERQVGEVVAYKSLAGAAYQNPLWQLVQHVANHSSYHRGQLINMYRALGAKPVATDMVVWDREFVPKSKRSKS
jgi:uncharacterized damage-inducible protein DinB